MDKPSRATLHALRTALEQPGMNQSHLFSDWPDTAEAYNDVQLRFLEELYEFGHTYHGGVTQYIRTARRLLGADDSASDMLELRMPQHLVEAPSLYEKSSELQALESASVDVLRKTVFVLVAGGLGERLGYADIKVSLPLQTATRVTYLEHYLQWAQAVGGVDVPFVIMTSDDTHTRTVKLLRRLPCAQGMTRMRLLKQETVPCLSDNEAHLTKDETGQLVRKPHGHGDIHSLIFSAKGMTDASNGLHTTEATKGDPHSDSHSGAHNPAHPSHHETGNQEDKNKALTQCWLDAGYEYICFMQDTNAIATTTIPISLAISAREKWAMNFTCVPRQPGEAVGLLCDVRMRCDDDEDEGNHTQADGNGVWVTRNIEYNVFESVARSLTEEGGDVAAKGSPYSAYPGSINTLICQLAPYAERVRATCGIVPEFINPKYADSSRRRFKKPARVESLMQDVALLFAHTPHAVGGTVFDRFSYQPVKNHMAEGVLKWRAQERPYCPTTGETDFYEFMRRRLRAVGVDVAERSEADGASTTHTDVTVADTISVPIFPVVVLDHVAAGRDTLTDLQRVFPSPADVHIGPGSTLMVEGHVVIESLRLDGALHVCGPSTTSEEPLVVRDVEVKNACWSVTTTGLENKEEADRVRGFVLLRSETPVLTTRGMVTEKPPKL